MANVVGVAVESLFFLELGFFLSGEFDRRRRQRCQISSQEEKLNLLKKPRDREDGFGLG